MTASGDLYFADTFNSAIREINASSGDINTVAGGSGFGYTGDGGAATAALLSDPGGVAVDSSGNLFIADTGNGVIREVSAATGDISTSAGADGGLVYTNDDGPATAATLANPDGIVVDSQGDIFIADEFFNVVREVNGTTGMMTTIAGNGTYGYIGDGGQATDAELADPAGLALDGKGDLFIADSANNVIREVNLTTGVITTVAGDGTYGGTGDGGAATQAELSNPAGVAVDSSGNIFIADEYDNEIREVSAATGDINTIAGDGTYGFGGDGGQATDANLSDPSAVALDGSGDLFIADTDNDVIRELNLTSGVITTVAGTPDVNDFTGDGGAPTAATLDGPVGIAVDSTGDLYIADTYNNAIREVSTPGGGQTVTVAKANLTITASDASKTYGTADSFAGQDFTTSALVAGDSVTSLTFASAGAASSAPVGTDPIVPSAAVGSGLSNYNITYANGTLTVTPAALTITASNASKGFGTTQSFAGTEFTETGLVTANGDAISTVTLSSTGAPASATVGNYSIVPSAAVGTGLGNYTIAYDNGTLAVTTATLTITAANASKVYGQTHTFAGTEFTTTGLTQGGSVTSVTLSSAGAAQSAAVGSDPITASAAVGSGLSNYTIVYDPGSLSVTPAALTITANNASKAIDTTASLGDTAFTQTGLVTANGDSVTSVTLTSTGAPAAAALGTYPIVPSAAVGTGLGNYTITYDNGTLTVAPAVLTITAQDASKVYGQSLTLGDTAFTVSGLTDGGSVTSVTLTSAGTAASAAVGTDPIVASAAVGSGLSNYTIVYDPGTLTVTPVALTITAGNASKTYGDTATLGTTNFTASGLVTANGDAISGVTLASTGAAATAGANTYPITASAALGNGLSNYTITYDPGVLTVNKAALTITANSATMTSGQAIPALSAAYSGFKNGDTSASLTTPAVIATTATSSSPAGTYPITVSGATSPNYAITFASGSLTVNPSTPPTPAATVESVTVKKMKVKKKTTEVIVVQFSEAMNQADAQNINLYTLVTSPTKKKQKSKAFPLATATYSASAMTVTLTTHKALVLNPPLKLTLNTSGLLDGLGRPLSGSPVATLSRVGAGTVTGARPLASTGGLSGHVVDALLGAGLRVDARRAKA